MSKKCAICGKGIMSGNNVSHSNRKTRRTFGANVQKVSVDGVNQHVCTKCIKTAKKNAQV